MELRARTRHAGILLTLIALLVPAVAGTSAAEAKRKKVKSPVVTRIAPMKVSIGETLTIKGRNFRPGRGKNTVAFKRRGGRAVFVKADVGTRKLLRVKLPDKLAGALLVRNGVPAVTRLQVRVLARKFGRKFTTVKRSPLIGPKKPPAPPAPPAAAEDGDCNGNGIPNKLDTDDDSDGLPDTLETTLKTDGCKPDSDGDGVSDGYEYKSAVDLNDDNYQNPNQSLPYPVKRPYPNPLYAGDANVDFDGDSLTLAEEFSLWKYTGAATLTPLSYSDGLQYSAPGLAADGYAKQAAFLATVRGSGYACANVDKLGTLYDIRDVNLSSPIGAVPGTACPNDDAHVSTGERLYYDYDGDGQLSDDERDEDGDGLTNYDEAHGRMQPGYWSSCYSSEKAFGVPYGATDLQVADTDADTVLDGADDQDHDDVPNLMELSRYAASGHVDWETGTLCKPKTGLPSPPATHHAADYGRVNPFNPCLPFTGSATCTRHPGFADAAAPFDGSPNWYSLN